MPSSTSLHRYAWRVTSSVVRSCPCTTGCSLHRDSQQLHVLLRARKRARTAPYHSCSTLHPQTYIHAQIPIAHMSKISGMISQTLEKLEAGEATDLLRTHYQNTLNHIEYARGTSLTTQLPSLLPPTHSHLTACLSQHTSSSSTRVSPARRKAALSTISPFLSIFSLANLCNVESNRSNTASIRRGSSTGRLGWDLLPPRMSIVPICDGMVV
jgi:hypothetical protein